MPTPLEPTDKFLSPGTGFRMAYRLLENGVYAPIVYAVGVTGGGGTGGGATTTVDGGNVAIGATTDTPATSDTAAASLIAIQKRSNQLQTLNWGAKLNVAPALGAGGSGGIGWLSQISTQLPASPGTKTSALSLSVTTASDDLSIGTKIDAAAALGAGGTGNIGWLSTIARRLLPGATNGAASLPVVIASDDAMIGTATTAAGALGAGGTGLMGWISTVALRLAPGVKASAASVPVVLASDDAQIGTKVTAIPALATGGTGLIGWLSALWQAQVNTGNQLPATIGTKTAALSLSVTPASDANLARETYASVVPLVTPTLAAGATFATFAGQACSQLDLIAPPTVDIEYRRGASTVYIPVMAGTSRLIQGLANANQISVRRLDQGAVPVNTFGEAYTV